MTGLRKFILKDRQPIEVFDVLEWGLWFESADRKVEHTDLGKKGWVRTYFIGVSSIGDASDLFTTESGGGMVFERIATGNWDAATRAHALLVNEVEKIKQRPGAKPL